MKIALAQINPIVGNLAYNTKKILSSIEEAKKQNIELLVFPEMCLIGYPPKDLLLKKSFIQANLTALNIIAHECKDISIILGFVDTKENNNKYNNKKESNNKENNRKNEENKESKLYNAAAVIQNQKIIHIYHKIHLPNYDVFDEKRYFEAGESSSLIIINNQKIGINICEDIWMDDGPVKKQAQQGADLIINISASPFHAGKATVRENLIAKRAKENNIPIIYTNLVGAQDDLIFDGRSYLFNNEGKMLAQCKAFEEDYIILPNLNTKTTLQPTENVIKDTHDALILGIKDYFHKNGFKKAIIGLSGGIDSALTAALAVEALGKENVVGITMPSKFSSLGSVDDSKILANNLNITIHTIAIKEIYDNYLSTLNPQFKNTSFNVAEENVQARIRGNLLMAMSNKFGYLVLATGNKSELSVGYATLYGDMAGGLAVISDLFKTTVYQVCEYINQKAKREIIPNAIITKEPSAELRDNQKDSDSLPIYSILDPILQAYVEEEKSKEEIINMSYETAIVERVIKLVDQNEYKRQQAALGFRITPRAFGSGRRMPITNGWRE